MAKAVKNLASNEDLVKKVASIVDAKFNEYKSEREQFEEDCKIADYMHKAAQNRTINSSEGEKGANLPADTRANVGSTIFHRQVNQRAAAGVTVMWSKKLPFMYSPVINENLMFSPDKGNEIANQLNVLAQWIMKQDGFAKKSIDFWNQVSKYSNVPVMIYQHIDRGTRKVRAPKYQTVTSPTGETKQEVVGYEESEKEYIVKNYPSFKVLPWASVYMDSYIGDVQQQSCVVILSRRNKEEIYDDVLSGFYDKDQFEKLNSKHKWDGSSEATFMQYQLENDNKDLSTSNTSEMFLQWDVFYRCPLKGEEYNEDEIPRLYWLTFFGNSISQAVCMRFERNPDPDDEIPIEMVRENPDDCDLLYHVMSSQIVRSNYSVECTLKGLAIDNIGLVCNPPVMAVEGMHRIRNFMFQKGAFWNVFDINAVKEFQVRDATQSVVPLLEYITNDSMKALSTDKTMMGESFGSRTSATEAGDIYSNSIQPHLVRIRYILDQLLPWYARKIKSYMLKYATPEQIVHVTGENQYPIVRPKELYGDFDVEVNIVDEFEADIVKEQKLYNIIQMVGQVPAFQNSPTHTIDMGELLKELFARAKLNGAKIVRPPMGIDSARVARMENIAMMEEGAQIEPKPGENHPIHINEHEGEALRYEGTGDQFEPQLTNLKIHSTKHKMLMNMETGSQMGAIENVSANKSSGEVRGNALAAALGGAA